MLNIQDITNKNANCNTFSDQINTPEKTYLTLANQFKNSEERKEFYKRIIEIHNINSPPESQIKIVDNSIIDKTYPKFNNWVAKVFQNVTLNEIAKMALLFDIFKEYESNMYEAYENIKIKVIKKIFIKYGDNIAVALLQNNISRFLNSKKQVASIEIILKAIPDIENIATSGGAIVDFNYKHTMIIHLLIENLTKEDIKVLLMYFEIKNIPGCINHKTNFLNNINKILETINNNYVCLASTIEHILNNHLLAKNIYSLL